MNIGKIGKSGEDRVAAFLRSKGYKIVKRNYQCRVGEIDIIAERREYIVFVEVKTRKAGSLVSGEEAVNFKKQERIILNIRQVHFQLVVGGGVILTIHLGVAGETGLYL
jgi:putative endonuclease